MLRKLFTLFGCEKSKMRSSAGETINLGWWRALWLSIKGDGSIVDLWTNAEWSSFTSCSFFKGSSLVSITLNYMNSVFRLVFRKCVFKEIVHPTMIVVPNLYEFLLLNTKEDILKNAGNQTFDSAFTSIVFLYLLWKSMGTRNCLVLQNSSKYLLLCST